MVREMQSRLCPRSAAGGRQRPTYCNELVRSDTESCIAWILSRAGLKANASSELWLLHTGSTWRPRPPLAPAPRSAIPR